MVGKPAFEELLRPVLGGKRERGGVRPGRHRRLLIITVLHVVVGELAPKTVAISRTRRTALLVAPVMRAFYLANKPVVELFNGMGNLLLRPFGIPPASEAGHAPRSEGELRALLRQSSEQDLIERDDQGLTENVFDLGDRRAREIMTPRPEIDFVTSDAGIGDVARFALTRGHTRLPLCEPGGGLDALEDILEELVGEIEDEFDPEASQAIRRDGTAAVVDGGASIRLLAQELRFEISERHEATIGGHLLEVLGRVPDIGEVIELDGHRIEVSGVDEARITHLRFAPRQP